MMPTQKNKNSFKRKHIVSTIVLIVYYILVALFVITLVQNANAKCGTGVAILIMLWAALSIVLSVVMIIIMLLKKGYSFKEYLIILSLILVPMFGAAKWFFF